jgi:hypothetical protein
MGDPAARHAAHARDEAGVMTFPRLTPDAVLIVAPYNSQVSLLSETSPSARDSSRHGGYSGSAQRCRAHLGSFSHIPRRSPRHLQRLADCIASILNPPDNANVVQLRMKNPAV